MRSLILALTFSAGASAAPTITGFTPSIGPVGMTVTIAGTGFSSTAANDFVYFGAVRATVTAASATSLTVKVPAGASLAPISVMTGGLTGYSDSLFVVNFVGRHVLDASSFDAHVDYLTHDPYNVLLGDFDGDGKPDLVVSNQFDTTISVFRNISTSGSINSGSVEAPLIVRVGRRPVGMAFGDLDGDGKPDLVVVDFDASTVSVLRNTSTGSTISFAAQVVLSTDLGSGPFNVAIQDLNADGKPDLAVANDIAGTISVYQNQSSPGTLTASSFATRVNFTTGSDPFVTIADINGDGKPDLVAANWGSNTLSVLRNLSTGGTITTSSFATKSDFATGTHPFSIAAGDIDDDGKVDLVTANESSSNASVLRNTSSGSTISFSTKIDYPTDAGSRFAAVCDLDGDGKLDLAVVNRLGDDISLLKNQSTPGSVSFASTVNIGANARARNIVAGDIDGDGQPELFVANEGTPGSPSNNVSVFRNLLGNGILITASAGLNGMINPSGTVSVASGGNQTFTITPDAGYHVDSVIVDGVNQGAPSSYTFTNVTAPHTIRAVFRINQYVITSSAGPNGSISPSGAVTVNHGSNQSFTVTPNANYHTDSLVVDGVNQGSLASYTFTNVTAAHTIRAVFAINQFTITASAGPNGTISPSGAVTVSAGASQSFTASPSTGYHMDSLIVDGANQGAVGSFTFTNVVANHTIRAVFRINQYVISSSAGPNGSISPSGAVTVNHGSNQSFTVTPNANYHTDSLVVDGVNQGSLASYTFTNVTAAHTIRAVFAINQFTITASAGPNGTISPSGAVTVSAGASQSFTASPSTGYHMDSLIVDGANQGAVGSFTFTNVTASHTIRAVFAINSYTITATAGANGTISPSGTVNVTFGGSQSFTISPSATYRVDSVIADGLSLGSLANYTFSNVTANHTIRATFTSVPLIASLRIPLTVNSAGVSTRNLFLGIHLGATAGISGVFPGATSTDSSEGEFELPPALTTVFDGRFVDPQGSNRFGNGSLIDVRDQVSSVQADTFKIAIQAGSAGYPLRVKWSKSSFASSFLGAVTLTDNLNNVTDMKLTDSVTISSSSVNSAMIVTRSPNLPVFYESGWNLVSVPANAPDPRKTVLFPQATSRALAFSAVGGFVPYDSLVPGPGYWLRIPPVMQNFSVAGTPVTRDTIDLTADWNLVGSVSVPVATASLSTIPPGIILGNIYGFDLAYFAADSIKPFRGYWLQSSQSGKLILAGSPSGEPRIASGPGAAATLTVRDALGKSQNLYLERPENIGDIRRFNLPPAPPAGTFDVRYSSDRMTEPVGANAQFPVKISGVAYPIEVSWRSDFSGILSAGSRRYDLGLNGSAVISGPADDMRLILVSGQEVPEKFSLEQNYPNPFNPTTQISYSLSEEAFVSVKVFTLIGQEVKTLAAEVQGPGLKILRWDATDNSGNPAASGIYFCRLETRSTAAPQRDFVQVRKMTLLR